jgi:hypothetical protein
MNPPLKVIGLLVFFFLLSHPSYSHSTSYRARYATAATVFLGEQQTNTPDGGTVLAGKWRQVSEDSSSVMVTRLDQYGNVLWSKYYRTGGLPGTFSVCALSDGSIALAVDLAYYIPPAYLASRMATSPCCRTDRHTSPR